MSDSSDVTRSKITKNAPRKYEYVYINIIVFCYYHIAAVYGLYLGFTSAKWATIFYNFLTHHYALCGVIIGAHRLWSHNSFKATKLLQLFLMLGHTTANQHSVIHWARDHRLHHKYSETDADPHNASRGFFYSHVGWLLVKKHPEVKKRGKSIDVSDLVNNPILKFQHDHNAWFLPLVAFVLPTVIPHYFWGESLSNAYHVNMIRYVFGLNLAFMINSVAHLWGYRPIDKNIGASGNLVTFYLTYGEGLHNYHHVYPSDYKVPELIYLDLVSKIIEFFAFLGMASDLKTLGRDTVEARAKRTGDGSFDILFEFDAKGASKIVQ